MTILIKSLFVQKANVFLWVYKTLLHFKVPCHSHRRTVGAITNEISGDLALIRYWLPKDGFRGIPSKLKKFPNKYTVRGEARQLWSAIIFSSEEHVLSFPKGREEILCYPQMFGSSSEVTFRPLIDDSWSKLNGKSQSFLMENFGAKSLMKVSVPGTHTLLVPEFPILQTIGYFWTIKLCWSSENKIRLCQKKSPNFCTHNGKWDA